MDPRLWWAVAMVALTVLFVLRRQLMKLYRPAAEWVRARPPLGLVLAIALSVLAAGFLAWKVPIWQLASRRAYLTAKEYLELQNSYRATIVQSLAGAVLLLTIYLTWRRVAATGLQVEVAREEQITERFTRAIEQLGSEKLEVRLGGIYALERIARDSERDHWPIMEVLTAFVREDAPVPWAQDKPEQKEGHERGSIRTDIQAILTVIGRRRVELDPPQQSLDLSWTNLSKADLFRADLSRADLSQADLSQADLSDAYVARANLSGAALVETFLSGAALVGANLSNAYLPGAHLSQARLSGADLSDASLRVADLSGARLSEAKVGGADLSHALLSEADLSKADLSRANLSKANLSGADLSETIGLTREQIESAITDEDTKLPDYLKEGGEGEPEAPAEAREED